MLNGAKRCVHSAFFIHNSAFNNFFCFHKPSDFVGMSSADDDMVVADGMLEQVGLQIHIQGDLCAAEMVAVGRFDGFGLGDEETVHLRATPFK